MSGGLGRRSRWNRKMLRKRRLSHNKRELHLRAVSYELFGYKLNLGPILRFNLEGELNGHTARRKN